MNNLAIKQYLAANPNTLVTYVRDNFGSIKGVVIAIGKNKIGWSMVNDSDDLGDASSRVDRLVGTPNFQMAQARLRRVVDASYAIGEDYIAREASKSLSFLDDLSNVLVLTKKYEFDKTTGFFKALERALGGEVKFSYNKSANFTEVFGVPNDRRLLDAVWSMSERSIRYFKEDKVAE